ncbi:MAG TPA: hypothetical protein VL086_09190 [Candidatus Nitrosotalea sp.]|nr:hypothetical protein [Candidatus Nitrosotalea sp.]
MAADSVFTLDQRYRGPSVAGKYYGHGGYFCGMVAQRAPGLAALAIRTWVPLERELVVEVSAGRVRVSAGATEVADSEVRGAPLPVTMPGSVSLGAARAAGDRFEGFSRHPFPECFACGHERAAGDGLRIFTGEVSRPVNGEKQLAGVWQPDPSWLDTDGYVRTEIVWAALDCPGGWAIPPEDVATVALQVEILERVPGDRPLIVRGWVQVPIDRTKKSRRVGSALVDEQGRVYALGGAIWSRVEPS